MVPYDAREMEKNESSVDLTENDEAESLFKDRKRISTEDSEKIAHLLGIIFEISPKQTELLIKLLENKDHICCVNHLTNEMKTGRSTIQKHMNALLKKGLVARESKTLAEFIEICQGTEQEEEYNTNKGYIFVYKAVDIDTIINKAREKLQEWDRELKILYDIFK